MTECTSSIALCTNADPTVSQNSLALEGRFVLRYTKLKTEVVKRPVNYYALPPLLQVRLAVFGRRDNILKTQTYDQPLCRGTS